MSRKISQDQPADDWAGLAQNLFGINLDKAVGDDDLLDDDMFKVELPKSPEPPVSISQSEVEFAPATESESAPVATAKPLTKVPSQRVVQATPCEEEPFGFGVVEATPVSGDAGLAVASDSSSTLEDAGLTLPEDYDVEGLTLPADYDDGLTLAPEGAATTIGLEEEEREEDEESDTEVLPVARGEAEGEGRSEARRRRHPRRTREDAYWDMLENWEWEEITDDDSTRGEGERPRSSRGDRGDRRGGRGDRGRRDRGRDERPRSKTRSSGEDRPPREERAPAEAALTSGSDSGERQRHPRRGDRPRDDRGSREDRPRGDRRPERDDRHRDEPRRAAPAIPSAAVGGGAAFDDFGSGIFEEKPQVAPPSASVPSEATAREPREEFVAQSSRAADAVLRSDRGVSGQSVEDELVWPDDDSDVRPAPLGSVVETSGLPPAEAAGESDEMVSASDVEPLEEDDEALRSRRRRRRRRRGERPDPRSFPPDGNEGTTFDLSDALAADGESPDFIPSAVADDSAVGEESSTSDLDTLADEERSFEQRGGRRRRRRRRPGEGPASDVVSRPSREPSEEGVSADVGEASDEESFVVKPITYSNIPSWEEAIKYLLQPHLVGRNLGPDDADESLENDPRGSGGAEPTPPPPHPRRRGGGGRGRRH